MNSKTYYSDITCQTYSAKDFLHMLEKRVRKHLRVNISFDPKQKYVVCESNSVASAFLKYIFTSLFEDRLDVLFQNSSTSQNDSRIEISDDCLEQYLAKKLVVFFNKEDSVTLTKQVISPLQCVSVQELQHYASISGLKYDDLATSQQREFITFVQNKYPQTTSSMLKTFLFLEQKS